MILNNNLSSWLLKCTSSVIWIAHHRKFDIAQISVKLEEHDNITEPNTKLLGQTSIALYSQYPLSKVTSWLVEDIWSSDPL